MMQNIKYISHKLAISLIITKNVSRAVKLNLNFVQEKFWTLNSRILQLNTLLALLYLNTFLFWSHKCLLIWWTCSYLGICNSSVLHSKRLGAVCGGRDLGHRRPVVVQDHHHHHCCHQHHHDNKWCCHQLLSEWQTTNKWSVMSSDTFRYICL